MQNVLIAIVGPTASGKTDVAIALAKYFATEILSADSRQVYREMHIGVAKPTTAQLQQVKHHFINHAHVQQAYTAGMYEREALQVLDAIFEKNNIAVLCGGSGLFVNALVYGLDRIPASTSLVRSKYQQLYEQQGIGALQLLLKERDEAYYAQSDTANPRRLMRALEAMDESGMRYSEMRSGEHGKRNFSTLFIGLTHSREVLNQRVNDRVEQMMQQGLLHEVENLFPFLPNKALETVGYAELFSYLRKECSLQEAVEKIKQHTRQYAKRQMTWFRRNENINWFPPTDMQGILTHIKTELAPKA